MFNPLLHALSSYPSNDWWRLLVDGKFHETEQGWRNFEAREPGCMKNYLYGLIAASEDITNPDLSEELIQRLHGKAMAGNPGAGVWRTEDILYGLSLITTSSQGLTEWLEYLKNDSKFTIGLFHVKNENDPPAIVIQPVEDDSIFSWYTSAAPCIRKDNLNILFQANGYQSNSDLANALINGIKEDKLVLNIRSSVQNIPRVKDVIVNFNEKRKQLTPRSDEMLELIVSTITSLERIHPFLDGNNRTLINIVFLRLLTQNQFDIPTFFEPNIFDGLSLEELCEQVKIGILNTQFLKENKCLFGFSSDVISPEIQTEWEETAARLSSVVNEYKLKIAQLIQKMESQANIKSTSPSFFKDPVINAKYISMLKIKTPYSSLTPEELTSGNRMC